MKYKNIVIQPLGLYPSVYMPTHPRAIASSGCVYVHILVAEEMLGRSLKEEECVHHIDENKWNFYKDNLMVFASRKDHVRYHLAKKSDEYILVCEHGVYTYRRKIATNICPICGGVKYRKSEICYDCAMKKRSKNIPSKMVLLYDLHKNPCWKTVGGKYGVSATAVRKWCRRYGLSDKIITYK